MSQANFDVKEYFRMNIYCNARICDEKTHYTILLQQLTQWDVSQLLPTLPIQFKIWLGIMWSFLEIYQWGPNIIVSS